MIITPDRPANYGIVPTPPKACCGNCAKRPRQDCQADPPVNGRFPSVASTQWCAQHERKAGE